MCKALSPTVTHELVTMTRRKIMRRDFWDKLYCELFAGRSCCKESSLVGPTFSGSTKRVFHPRLDTNELGIARSLETGQLSSLTSMAPILSLISMNACRA